MNKKLYTVEEIMAIYKVSQITVWRWCKSGKVQASKQGRRWYITFPIHNKIPIKK